MNECQNCLNDLLGSPPLPREEGSNPYAYVTCRRCNHDNTVYGYGEDDQS